VVADRIWNHLPSDALLARTSQQLFLPVVENHPLRCVALDRRPPAPASANMVQPTYCLEVERPALRRERYIGVVSSELSGETIYNDTKEFHGHFVAREVRVTHFDKPYVNVRIEALEDMAPVDDAAFQPPVNAEPVGTPRLVVPDAEMRLRLVQYKNPGFAQMLRDDVDQRVVLSVIVGQDGSVSSVRAVGGWQVLQQLVSKAVMQSAYRPYLVDGKPVEIETEVIQTFQTTRH